MMKLAKMHNILFFYCLNYSPIKKQSDEKWVVKNVVKYHRGKQKCLYLFRNYYIFISITSIIKRNDENRVLKNIVTWIYEKKNVFAFK